MSKRRRLVSVFINCPIDAEYQEFFDAIVFTIMRCGFAPRCAIEIIDTAGTRIDTIFQLIQQCPLAVHDISRTELDSGTNLPRFNMPFELGLFIGACRYGSTAQHRKKCLVLDKERYRYQKFLSDISGQDISSHDGNVQTLIRRVRDFLRTQSGDHIPGASTIHDSFLAFQRQKPAITDALELEPTELAFADYLHIVSSYLNPSV